MPYDQQCHGFVQVVKRLTAMASHEESDLFDLYSKVSCLVESYSHVRHLLHLQVEIPTGSKAHIEELEGERDHAQ